MRILIDTNIFIYRENEQPVPEDLQNLLKVLNELDVDVLLHPKSIEELRRNPDEVRKKVILSKVSAYKQLESPPNPDRDSGFVDIVGPPSTRNDYIDNAILYAVFKDAVDFLITEDRGIHNKAAKLALRDRVLLTREVLVLFRKRVPDETVSRPPALKEEAVHNLNVNDPFFDPLREDYGKDEFEDWFGRISKAGRKCWVYLRDDGSIGALLIYKPEDEAIVDSAPILPRRKRLKLSTFKVEEIGHRIGELFIKLAVEYAIKHNLLELYFTHFTRQNDYLVNLVNEYGFFKKAVYRTGEDVLVKELLPNREKLRELPSYGLSKTFWPSFFDGARKRKFIVPIQPLFHDRLFIEHPGRQTELTEHLGEFVIEGNTIEKAYICHSGITKISLGDVLLFYRSQDWHELTTIGIVEQVHRGLRDGDKI